MRLDADGQSVRRVVLFLSRSEAAELRDDLEHLLENYDSPDWHAHISSPDYQTEITIASERA